MNKSDVFISYKSEELAIATLVKKRIEEAGISCWMAPSSIPGGSSYAMEIPQAIRNCRVFVLILSRLAQESKWVPRELDQAINANKVIMPYTIDDSKLKNDFDFYLTNVQRYPAYQNNDEVLEKMVQDICAVLGKEYHPPVVPEEEETGNEAGDVEENTEEGETTVPEQASGEEEETGTEIEETGTKTEETGTKTEETGTKTEETGTKIKETPPPKKGSGKIIAAAAAILLVLIAVLAVKFMGSNPFDKTIIICGEEVARDTSYLLLSDTTITEEDAKAIGSLNGLETLNLESCKISSTDLSAMLPSGLTDIKMKDCNLSKVQISQIPFDTFELSWLDLSGNKGFDSLDLISSQAGTLRTLDISNTFVKDLSSLSSYEKLTELSIDNLGITDLSDVSKLANLTHLSACRNKLTTLEPLSEMMEMRELKVNYNKLKDLKGIEKMIRLEELEAAGNKLTNTKELENMTKLKVINLTKNQINNISQLQKSEATLEKVYLGHNQITDLKYLGSGKNIQYLNAENNQITDISTMNTFRQLKACCLRDNSVYNTKRLEKLFKCSYLDLSRNKITEIDLSYLKAADIIKLTDNPLTALKVPDHKVRYLGLGGIKNVPAESLKALQSFYLTINYNNELNPTMFKDKGYSKVYLVDCPLDQQVSWEDTFYGVKFISADEVSGIDDEYTSEVQTKALP